MHLSGFCVPRLRIILWSCPVISYHVQRLGCRCVRSLSINHSFREYNIFLKYWKRWKCSLKNDKWCLELSQIQSVSRWRCQKMSAECRCPGYDWPGYITPSHVRRHNVNIPHILITIFNMSSGHNCLFSYYPTQPNVCSRPPRFRPPGMLLSSSEILCFQTPDSA